MWKALPAVSGRDWPGPYLQPQQHLDHHRASGVVDLPVAVAAVAVVAGGKGSLKNDFTFLGAYASRLAALRKLGIRRRRIP